MHNIIGLSSGAKNLGYIGTGTFRLLQTTWQVALIDHLLVHIYLAVVRPCLFHLPSNVYHSMKLNVSSERFKE